MKVKLTTVVLLFIILILAVALVIVYYLGFVKNDQKEVAIPYQNATSNVINNNQNINANTNKEAIDITENEESVLLTTNELITKIGANNDISYLTNSFCIDTIEETQDGYVVTACLLSKEAKEISKQELQTIKSGGEIEFRNKKWKIEEQFSNQEFLRIKSGEKQLSINLENNYLYNVAGVFTRLLDYSGEKIKFEVDKNIPVCYFEYYFEYDTDGVIHQYVHGQKIEKIPMQTYNIEHLKDILKRASGSYEECALYINNGKIDAIQSYDKF